MSKPAPVVCLFVIVACAAIAPAAGRRHASRAGEASCATHFRRPAVGLPCARRCGPGVNFASVFESPPVVAGNVVFADGTDDLVALQVTSGGSS